MVCINLLKENVFIYIYKIFFTFIFNFIDKKDSNQMKTYIEANKAENQKGINDLLGFKETYIYKIISLISDCDDSILIERDKITLNLRKNARVIDSNNLKM